MIEVLSLNLLLLVIIFLILPIFLARGGGLASVFKNNFCCRIIETDTFTSFEVQLFSLGQINSLVVAVVYHPPKTNKNFITEFSEFLGGITPKFYRILIVGDFNIHVCCNSTVLAKAFLSLIDACDICQWVKEPTHAHGHIVDLVLAHGLSISDVHIGDLSFSDQSLCLLLIFFLSFY